MTRRLNHYCSWNPIDLATTRAALRCFFNRIAPARPRGPKKEDPRAGVQKGKPWPLCIARPTRGARASDTHPRGRWPLAEAFKENANDMAIGLREAWLLRKKDQGRGEETLKKAQAVTQLTPVVFGVLLPGGGISNPKGRTFGRRAKKTPSPLRCLFKDGTKLETEFQNSPTWNESDTSTLQIQR